VRRIPISFGDFMSRYSFRAALAMLLAFSGCVDQRILDAIAEAEKAEGQLQVQLDGPEALAWLKGNKNESALASNRFLGTENAVKFVKALYAAGATKVVVPKDAINSEEDTVSFEGGPYADALVVTLPTDDADAREAVVQMCRVELRREGFDSPEVASSPSIYLWWD
jgi:hypothetical protein